MRMKKYVNMNYKQLKVFFYGPSENQKNTKNDQKFVPHIFGRDLFGNFFSR